jgi:hypothetical protein
MEVIFAGMAVGKAVSALNNPKARIIPNRVLNSISETRNSLAGQVGMAR